MVTREISSSNSINRATYLALNSGDHVEKKEPTKSDSQPIDSFKLKTLPRKKKCPVATKLKEIALKAATSEIAPRVSVNLPAGFSLAIKVLEHPYLVTDSRISGDDIKAAYSKTLEKQRGVRHVVWLETGGALELGAGINGTLPIAYFAGVEGGFKASGLLSYRQIQPVTVGNFSRTATALKGFCPMLPFSAKAASQMPPGSEFEISGQGKIVMSAKLAVNAGVDALGQTARIAHASVGASGELSRTYQLKIYSLDGKAKVRITLSDISDSKLALLGTIILGGDVSFPAMPDVGNGALQFIAEQPKDLSENLLSRYLQAKLDAEVSSKSTDRELCTFDMDLAQPDAARAFENMLKLSPADAVTLSFHADSGVKMVKVVEHEDTDLQSIGITFLGSKMLLAKALDVEKQGRAHRMAGPQILYRETGFKKEFSSWFTGQKEVLWETVSVQDEREVREPSPKQYFRFHFTEKNYVTKQQNIDWFFRFADMMGVKKEKDVKKTLPHMDKIKKILSSADDTTSEVDIYFTEKSLHTIKNSSFQKAFYAYSNAVAYLEPQYQNIPWLKDATPNTERATKILISAVHKNSLSYFSFLPIFDAGSTNAKEYRALIGRNLHTDMHFYQQAEAFAIAIENFRSTSSIKAVESWFMQLGKKKGFDYMATLAALCNLTGQEECLVHKLNLKGGGICLQSVDEGALVSPSTFATELLA